MDVGVDGYLIERDDSAIPVPTHTDALDQFEAVLLQVTEPRLAKRGPNWNGTKEYFQFVMDEATTLEHLWEELQELKASVAKNRN